MTTTDSFALLRERRKVIAEELQGLRSRLDALAAEDRELASAERVLLRFGATPSEPVARPASDMPTGKPEGTPTTPNMILTLLREARDNGKDGLEPREMQIGISKRWWPGVRSDDVAPTAWRMWKDGRLTKEGSVYSIAPALPWKQIVITDEDDPTSLSNLPRLVEYRKKESETK